MFPIPVALMSVAALAFFTNTTLRWVRISKKGRPDDRFNDFGKRLKNLLTIAFAQTRMIRGDFKAGLMHAVIFWGFLVVSLRTILLFGQGFDAGFGTGFLESLPGKLYISLLNVFELLVLMAVTYAAYRRVVVKPERLTLSAEGLRILGDPPGHSMG